MNRSTTPPPTTTSHIWVLVLCLVGLDYFSTLAYLPSIAVEAAGQLAPLAAAIIALVTLLVAAPLYAYIVGRSPHGRGATGLLERTVFGWRGKLLVLVLMGFVATDFVVTRSLSVADASIHLLHNPHWKAVADRVAPHVDGLCDSLDPSLAARVRPYCTRQVAMTIGLSSLAFAVWLLLQRGFTRTVLWVAAAVTGTYLLLSGYVIVRGLQYLADHRELLAAWTRTIHDLVEHDTRAELLSSLHLLLPLALWSFPQMALGFSGFELSMTIAPLVRGRADDDSEHPRGRIRNTRRLLVVAAAIMSLCTLAAILAVTLLVPADALVDGGPAQHRALAYLAHGGALADGQPGTALDARFGEGFGLVYDLATTIILCLAGASVMIGLRELVPQYLHRLGMELTWAHRLGAMMHIFNVIIVVITLVFQASVSAQQWAYATSVLALLTGASLAALADISQRTQGRWYRRLAMAPPVLALAFFLAMCCLTVYINRSGLWIALAFVGTIVVTSSVSRWLRSTELRFQGFNFDTETAKARWDEILHMEEQVLVPHRPGKFSLAEKNVDIRRLHRLPAAMPLFFIEAQIGDPSEFYQTPRLRIDHEGGLEVIRVSGCASIAHVIASIGLELRHVGRPPEILFGWSHETPLAANLNFLLLGEGNVPWMVKELIRKAEPNADRQPRVVVG